MASHIPESTVPMQTKDSRVEAIRTMDATIVFTSFFKICNKGEFALYKEVNSKTRKGDAGNRKGKETAQQTHT